MSEREFRLRAAILRQEFKTLRLAKNEALPEFDAGRCSMKYNLGDGGKWTQPKKACP